MLSGFSSVTSPVDFVTAVLHELNAMTDSMATQKLFFMDLPFSEIISRYLRLFANAGANRAAIAGPIDLHVILEVQSIFFILLVNNGLSIDDRLIVLWFS